MIAGLRRCRPPAEQFEFQGRLFKLVLEVEQRCGEVPDRICGDKSEAPDGEVGNAVTVVVSGDGNVAGLTELLDLEVQEGQRRQNVPGAIRRAPDRLVWSALSEIVAWDWAIARHAPMVHNFYSGRRRGRKRHTRRCTVP